MSDKLVFKECLDALENFVFDRECSEINLKQIEFLDDQVFNSKYRHIMQKNSIFVTVFANDSDKKRLNNVHLLWHLARIIYEERYT